MQTKVQAREALYSEADCWRDRVQAGADGKGQKTAALTLLDCARFHLEVPSGALELAAVTVSGLLLKPQL